METNDKPLKFYSQNNNNNTQPLGSGSSSSTSNLTSIPILTNYIVPSHPLKPRAPRNQVKPPSVDLTPTELLQNYLLKITGISKRYDIENIYRPALQFCLQKAEQASTLTAETKAIHLQCINKYYSWCTLNRILPLPISGFTSALYLVNLPQVEKMKSIQVLEGYRLKCSTTYLNGGLIALSGINWMKKDMEDWMYYVGKSQIPLGLFELRNELMTLSGAVAVPQPQLPLRPPAPTASTSALPQPQQQQARSKQSTAHSSAQSSRPAQPNQTQVQSQVQNQSLVQQPRVTQNQPPPQTEAPPLSNVLSQPQPPVQFNPRGRSRARQDKGKEKEHSSNDNSGTSTPLRKNEYLLPQNFDVGALLDPIRVREKYEARKEALEIAGQESVWNSGIFLDRREECQWMRSIWTVEDILEQIEVVEKLERDWIERERVEHVMRKAAVPTSAEEGRADNLRIMQSAGRRSSSHKDRSTTDLPSSITSRPYGDYIPRLHFEGWTQNIVVPIQNLPLPSAFGPLTHIRSHPIEVSPFSNPAYTPYVPKIRTSDSLVSFPFSSHSQSRSSSQSNLHPPTFPRLSPSPKQSIRLPTPSIPQPLPNQSHAIKSPILIRPQIINTLPVLSSSSIPLIRQHLHRQAPLPMTTQPSSSSVVSSSRGNSVLVVTGKNISSTVVDQKVSTNDNAHASSSKSPLAPTQSSIPPPPPKTIPSSTPATISDQVKKVINPIEVVSPPIRLRVISPSSLEEVPKVIMRSVKIEIDPEAVVPLPLPLPLPLSIKKVNKGQKLKKDKSLVREIGMVVFEIVKKSSSAKKLNKVSSSAPNSTSTSTSSTSTSTPKVKEKTVDGISKEIVSTSEVASTSTLSTSNANLIIPSITSTSKVPQIKDKTVVEVAPTEITTLEVASTRKPSTRNAVSITPSTTAPIAVSTIVKVDSKGTGKGNGKGKAVLSNTKESASTSTPTLTSVPSTSSLPLSIPSTSSINMINNGTSTPTDISALEDFDSPLAIVGNRKLKTSLNSTTNLNLEVTSNSNSIDTGTIPKRSKKRKISTSMEEEVVIPALVLSDESVENSEIVDVLESSKQKGKDKEHDKDKRKEMDQGGVKKARKEKRKEKRERREKEKKEKGEGTSQVSVAAIIPEVLSPLDSAPSPASSGSSYDVEAQLLAHIPTPSSVILPQIKSVKALKTTGPLLTPSSNSDSNSNSKSEAIAEPAKKIKKRARSPSISSVWVEQKWEEKVVSKTPSTPFKPFG